MKTRILKVREHGFVAQYTVVGYTWSSISDFLPTDIEAACELASFIREMGVQAEYTGIVVIK